MTQMIMEIPDTLINLPQPERDVLVREGLYEAVRAWIRQLEAEIAESEEHINHFKARYGVPFARFETEILPTLDTPQSHEDYNDWFFWQSVLTEKKSLLSKVQKVKPD